MLGARFLQARFGFLPFNLQADTFFDHLDLAPVDALGGAQPRGCLIERRARGRRVGAFDGQQRRTGLDHLPGLNQHSNHAPCRRGADRGLRLRTERHAARQREHIRRLGKR